MTDSHNVHFRGEDDQPCPNCGTVVEKFEEASRYDYYEGYECPDCEVRWDWEEWNDGVRKVPDPDPDKQAASLESRLIGHCYQDIWNAVEDGCFAVETPRVHASKTTFDSIDIGIERDVMRERRIGGDTWVGQPYLTARFEWVDEDTLLFEDFHRHVEMTAEVVLHGRMHYWQMETQRGREVSIEHDGHAIASFEWYEVSEVGWQ